MKRINRQHRIITFRKKHYYPIVIDIGNNRIKVLFSDRKAIKYYNIKNFSPSKFADFINQFATFPALVCYSTVNPEILEKIKYSKYANEIKFYNIILLCKKIIHYSEIQGIGDDRILGLIGGMKFFKPPLITVDCGTAITINVINHQFECIGGTISPGMTTQINSLHNSTAQLKKIGISYPETIMGKNTTDALRCGIVLGTIGAVREIIFKICYKEFNQKKIPIVVSGGDGQMIYDGLYKQNKDIIYSKDIVIDGILKLFEIYEWNIS